MRCQRQVRYHTATFSLLKIVSLVLVLIIASSPAAVAEEASFPRLGSIQIGRWNQYDRSRIDKIARLDVAIIGLFRNHNIDGHTVRSIVADIKGQNPNIALLQYALVSSIPDAQKDLVAELEAQDGPRGQGDWFARNASGSKTSEWPGQSAMNITEFVTPNANGDRVPQWYSKVLNQQLFGLAPFDGIFIDVMRPKPQVVADWDGDGVEDATGKAAPWYSRGQRDFFDAHQAAWPNHIMTANFTRWVYDAIPEYYRGILHGGVMEGMIGLSWSPHTWGGWDTMMEKYRQYMGYLVGPRYGFFHANGPADDYQFMRYSLASCLMDDGYYAHSTSENFDEVAWFDEYEIDLGVAIDGPQMTPWRNGIYRRRFSKGIALVNPEGNGDRTVELEPGYRKFLGTQDPVHNDGTEVRTLRLKDGDGIILVSDNALQTPKPKPPVLQ